MLFYRAALPLSSQTLNYAAGAIRRHRKSIGSRSRKLNPGQQALLVLAYLRKGEAFAELAAGFGIGITTACRPARRPGGEAPQGGPGREAKGGTPTSFSTAP